MKLVNIKIYKTHTGKTPYTKWRDKLDVNTAAIIAQRIDRVILGNFGDCDPIKGIPGLHELRIHYGPGYRVYFGETNDTLIILLTGGNKASQNRDVAKAETYWFDYKERENE